MTDLDKWKEWLDYWNVSYTVVKYQRTKQTILLIDGNWAWTEIIFNTSDNSFVCVSASE